MLPSSDAILGAVVTIIVALVPAVIYLVRERKVRRRQAYKFVYVRMRHLTKQAEGRAPVYRKFIPRLNKEIEVFDEFDYFRLNIFRETVRDFTSTDRTSGAVDMHILHPQQQLVFPDQDAKEVKDYLVQSLDPSEIFLTKTMYFNGFQEGHENFGVKMERDTEQVRMIVDFSAIPGFASLVSNAPQAVLRRKNHEEFLGVIQDYPGIYSVSKEKLKQDDVIRIDFHINWSIFD